MKIELSSQEIGQLMGFLNRITLQPPEIAVFLPLVQKIERQAQAQQTAMPMPQPTEPQNINKPSKSKR